MRNEYMNNAKTIHVRRFCVVSEITAGLRGEIVPGYVDFMYVQKTEKKVRMETIAETVKYIKVETTNVIANTIIKPCA